MTRTVTKPTRYLSFRFDATHGTQTPQLRESEGLSYVFDSLEKAKLSIDWIAAHWPELGFNLAVQQDPQEYADGLTRFRLVEAEAQPAATALTSLAVLALVVLLAFSTACSTRSVQGAVTAQAAATAPSPAVSPDARVRHVCGAKTKAGTACKNPVKAEGARCHLHAGQPVLQTAQNNPCWLPKGSAPKEDCYYEDGDTTRPDSGKP